MNATRGRLSLGTHRRIRRHETDNSAAICGRYVRV
jgi:hypothetical protein